MPAQVATTADLEALAQEITALRRELEALRAQVQAPPRFVRLKDAARELDRSESYLRGRFRDFEGLVGWGKRQDASNPASNILINVDAFREWEAKQ